jgi:hypothetical protein
VELAASLILMINKEMVRETPDPEVTMMVFVSFQVRSAFIRGVPSIFINLFTDPSYALTTISTKYEG